MKPHQNDDDMRITTSHDVLLDLQDRLTQAEQESTALNLTMDRQTKRIAELEAQLEAVGAGGVGAMVPTVKDSLQVQPAPAVVEPAYWLTENGDLFSRAEFAAMYAPGRKLTPLYMHPAPQPQQIAEPASPWVSVAERLPPAHTDVMIYPRPTDYCCEAAVNTNGCWSYSEYESNWGQHRVPCRVTHWMPFPAAPTKEPS